MGFIKKIELPDNNIYDIKNTIIPVVGTQSAATGNWTGNIDVPALYDGLTISYFLPWAPSGNASLNLTLNDGTTTGAINCYYNSGRLTTHFGKGSNIIMTYYSAGSISIDGVATTDNRWIVNANYASNDIETIRPYYYRVQSGTNGLKQYGLFARQSDGRFSSFTKTDGTATTKEKNTPSYFIDKIFYLFNGNNVDENEYTGWQQCAFSHQLVDLRYSLNITTSSLTANKFVYLVFNEDTDKLGTHTLADIWWTQDLPTTADNKIYVLLGMAYDGYRANLALKNPAFVYKNGIIKLYEDTYNSSVNRRWTAVSQGKTWSRLYYASPVTSTIGTSGILSLGATRGSVVYNATFLITSSHAGANYSTCIELASCNYCQIKSRLIVASNGTYYFEIYDEAQNIEVGTAQTWHCCFIPIMDTNITTYTSFVDGTTIPSGYNSTNEFTTTGGSSAAAVKSITRNGTTFTATRQNGSTFTFTQQDNDTKNTAGSTDTSSKIFLIGATSQGANPQTYSDDQVFVTNGALQANTVNGTILGVNASNGTSGGISLYSGTGNIDNYGIAFRLTSNKEKHGYVQGDWATYFTMNSGGDTRGWVYRQNKTGGNVASISGLGHMVLNGSLTVGGNQTNTSGCRMEYNTTTQSLDFIFN